MTWTNLNNTAVRKISHSFITYEETEALKLFVSIQVLSKDLPRLRFLGGPERAALSEKGRKPVVPRTSLRPTFQHCVRVRWLSLLVVLRTLAATGFICSHLAGAPTAHRETAPGGDCSTSLASHGAPVEVHHHPGRRCHKPLCPFSSSLSQKALLWEESQD